MHFAYPPRKSSNPPPFRPRTSRLPGIPTIRRSRLKAIAVFGLAIIGLIWLLRNHQSKPAYKPAHVPSGMPPVVIVTIMESKGYDPEYIQSLRENRESYAKLHGYETFITSVENYNLKGSPASWAKVVAMRHAMTKFPDANFFWYLEQSALIMNPAMTVERDVMNPGRLNELMIRNKPVVPPDSIITTFSHLKAEEIDLAITMDNLGMSVGSFVIRNGDWAQFFLDTWFDPLYRSYNFQKADVHALEHVIQWHPTVLSKLALIPQRIINAYHRVEKGERYSDGDFVVRFPNCPKEGEKSCQKESAPFMERWRKAFSAA